MMAAGSSPGAESRSSWTATPRRTGRWRQCCSPAIPALASIAKVNFNAFPELSYGASVAGGDVLPQLGDAAEVVVARGPHPSSAYTPQARTYAFDVNVPYLTSLAGNPLLVLPYGLHVEVGEIDGAANGAQDVVFGDGPGPSRGTRLVAYTGGRNLPIGDPLLTKVLDIGSALGVGSSYGVRLGATNVDADPGDEILLSRGWDPAGDATVRVRDPICSGTCTAPQVLSFLAFSGTTHGACPAGASSRAPASSR